MPLSEKRTQLYLTSEQHRAVMDAAHRRGTSLAGVVREALEQYLRTEGGSGVSRWQDDPVLELVGAFELPALSAGESLNDAIDRSLYDEEVPPWSSPTHPVSYRPSTRATHGTPKGRARGGVSRKRAKRS
jgi:hypothetical protein